MVIPKNGLFGRKWGIFSLCELKHTTTQETQLFEYLEFTVHLEWEMEKAYRVLGRCEEFTVQAPPRRSSLSTAVAYLRAHNEASHRHEQEKDSGRFSLSKPTGCLLVSPKTSGPWGSLSPLISKGRGPVPL